MAYLIVKIEIPGTAEKIKETLENDRRLFEEHGVDNGWVSALDGTAILVDEGYLRRSRADDSFFAFELVGIED